jgi:hypothetical protein
MHGSLLATAAGAAGRVRQAAWRCTSAPPAMSRAAVWVPADNLAGAGHPRPEQPLLPWNRLAPPWWQRSGSITGHSPTVHALGGWFIRRSPAIGRHRGRRGGTTKQQAVTPRRWRACGLRLPSRTWGAGGTPAPTQFDRLQHPVTGKHTPRETSPQHRCGRRSPSSSRAIGPSVRVAAPAGQAPPPATGGPPQARPASA